MNAGRNVLFHSRWCSSFLLPWANLSKIQQRVVAFDVVVATAVIRVT